MQDDTAELVSKLKFISKIQKGEKINVPCLFIQSEGWGTTISRTVWNTDNRQSALNFVQTTVCKCFEIVESSSTSENMAEIELVKTILIDLNKSKDGIKNLRHTYKSDTMLVCTLDTLVEKINRNLLKLKESNPQLFE